MRFSCIFIAAASAPTAPTANIAGPGILEISEPNVSVFPLAAPIFVTNRETGFKSAPRPVAIPPTIFSAGYPAAVNNTILAIMSFVAGERSLNFETRSFIPSTTFVNIGARVSPIEIPALSSVDFKIVIEPLVLSSIVSAMLFAAPSALPSASSSFFMSFGLAFIIARNPDIAFLPTRLSAAVAFSEAVRSLNAARVSLIMSPHERMEPSAFVVFMVVSPRRLLLILKSLLREVIILRSEVPACDDLIPALPMSPMLSATSSILYPSEPAIGAAYLKVSPIILTFVLAFALAAAKTSAKCVESSAFSPNAVNASVTMSDVVARSSPEAAARFITPSRPESMSSVFQPAIAM